MLVGFPEKSASKAALISALDVVEVVVRFCVDIATRFESGAGFWSGTRFAAGWTRVAGLTETGMLVGAVTTIRIWGVIAASRGFAGLGSGMILSGFSQSR